MLGGGGGGGGTILLIAYSGFLIVYIFFVGREEGKHTDCMFIIHEYLKPLRNMILDSRGASQMDGSACDKS